MARLPLKECMKLAATGTSASAVDSNTAIVGGVIFGLWWWARGVPEEWVDPDDPRRARRDL